MRIEERDDRSLYYRLVLEHAHSRAVAGGRLLDLYDADPDRLMGFLSTREWRPLQDGRAGRTALLTVEGAEATLEGTIHLLGADGLLKTRFYQAVLEGPGGTSCMTVPERSSWVGPMPLRVAPLQSVLLVGLDETNVELARGLRTLGMRVLLAQQAGGRRREVFLDLHDGGYPVFEVEDADGLSKALREIGAPELVVLGFSSDTRLTPEGNVQEGSELDAADAELAAAARSDEPLAFERISGEALHAGGPSLLPLPEAAVLEFLLPVVEGAGEELQEEGVEAAFDLTLPTTVPYGEKNRHSTDDITFRAASGIEAGVLDALENLDPTLPSLLAPVESSRRALSVRTQIGPWTVHLAGTVTIRARKTDGEYLRAEEYEQRLKEAGDVRVIPLPEKAGSVRTLLDGTYLQNIVFSKLRAIHSYRPAAVVVPLTDESFQVFFVAPQISYGVVGRLRTVLAASGLAGEEQDAVRRVADEALDIPRIDARVRHSFPKGEGPPPMDDRPGLPQESGFDPIAAVLDAAGETSAPPAAPTTEEFFEEAGWDAIETEVLDGFRRHRFDEGCVVALGEGETAVLEVRETDDGHTLRTAPVAGLDLEDPKGNALYVRTLLEYLHQTVLSDNHIVRVYDRHADELKRLLAARMMEFVPDADVPGRATAPIEVGSLRGTRYRLGSERVASGDRVVQVDLYKADDASEEPRSITLALGPGVDDPIVVMPTTVQLVFGFGNICGDLGVLERRLAYRVVAFNRSPNERALSALENGVPLYEFDESLDEQGNTVEGDGQREAYERAGLRLSGKLRDLLDEGLVVGETDRGLPVRARVGHILDGLLGSIIHPVTGEKTKISEYYKELLFDEYEERGVPTIYNGSNSPEKVADGRIFIHDAFTTYGLEPAEHYEEHDGPTASLMCVSCNTTNITGILLRLTDVPGMSDMKIRVMTHRKANDQYVGEGKQSVNYSGMAFDFHYHHWEDAKLFYDRIKDRGLRRRLGAMFALDNVREDDGGEWAISTHATGQAATEFHTGVVNLSGKLRGEPLDAEELKSELTRRESESAQLIEFPGKVDARHLLETLHYRIGIRNLYIQPFTVVQDGDDLAIVFFTPHLFNVKPNNLVAALNRDGLISNTISGTDIGTRIVSEALGLGRQQTGLVRYYGTRSEQILAGAQPIYFFGGDQVEGTSIPSWEERRQVLGGKGAGMTEMAAITYRDPLSEEETGLPVPPGYTITTEQARRYFENGGQLPPDLVAAIDEYQARLESVTGKALGDPDDPLLVSVRSGAAVSMPGMMDTILNLGLNHQSVEGLASQSGDRRFAWDCYLRFTEQFADIALGVDDETHLKPLRKAVLEQRGVDDVSGLELEDLEHLTWEYQHAVLEVTGQPFPQDTRSQLLAAIEAVFESSYSERAVFFRRVNKIPETAVSAVSVVSMVFGNRGDDSGTGVCFTRSPLTGENVLVGEYLTNAQGEDVVAGIRAGKPIEEMKSDPKLSGAYRQLYAAQEALERHFRDPQDVEFTIESGRLFILQTRALGGRTGRASLKIVTDMVEEGVLSPQEAVLKYGDPEGLNELLQPAFDPEEEEKARQDGRRIAAGIPASAGAATGEVTLHPEQAEVLSQRGHDVILVRHETSPEDVSGLHASNGVLTARGGVVSHAAIVARGMGKAAVVGAESVEIDERQGVLHIGGEAIASGEVISIDGTTGEVFLGALPVVPSPIKARLAGEEVDSEGEELYERVQRLLGWARAHKAVEIRCNTETEEDLEVALSFGAEGVGLARTEHYMLSPEERRTAFTALILAQSEEEHEKALKSIYPVMEQAAGDIFRLLEGRPATIRLFDPVPNEFLPHSEVEMARVAGFMELSFEETRHRCEVREETNPMLGFRGVRLYVLAPEIARSQTKAILMAAARCMQEDIQVRPEIQIPMVINRTETLRVVETIQEAAQEVMEAEGIEVPYKVGAMIETPAAVRTADTFSGDLQFLSYGVNDLTQTVLAISRDDTGHFMGAYEELGIVGADPFRSLDPIVKTFVEEALERARRSNPDVFVFASGDLGGDPHSVRAFHDMGLDGVSASPWLVPVSTLAAAQANLAQPREPSGNH
ncbi:MAG TPA: pyruvate, phosphate dikinase [Rubrobacteraceae bacterium]|nr:pyruvate, phosphate dikinase [Rubrobacteraceae bacterium]